MEAAGWPGSPVSDINHLAPTLSRNDYKRSAPDCRQVWHHAPGFAYADRMQYRLPSLIPGPDLEWVVPQAN
jgi:hypothetical protein